MHISVHIFQSESFGCSKEFTFRKSESVTKNPFEYWNWSALHWRSVDYKRKPIENKPNHKTIFEFNALSIFFITKVNIQQKILTKILLFFFTSTAYCIKINFGNK